MNRHPLPQPPPRPLVDRRTVVKGAAALLGGSAVAGFLPRFASASAPDAGVEWYVTTAASPWQKRALETTSGGGADVMVQADTPLQAIEGFGACFNELGWTSLSLLSPADRDSVLRELFAPGVGAGFTLARMPVGANDFSRDGTRTTRRRATSRSSTSRSPTISIRWSPSSRRRRSTSPGSSSGRRPGARPPG